MLAVAAAIDRDDTYKPDPHRRLQRGQVTLWISIDAVVSRDTIIGHLVAIYHLDRRAYYHICFLHRFIDYLA